MRTMALDVGDKTIGVAVTDPIGVCTHGLETIRRRDIKKDLGALSKYVEEYDIGVLVVGLPLRDEGEIGIQARKILKFVEIVKKELGGRYPTLVIKTWDESMTTAEAHEIFSKAGLSSKKRKKVVDQLAAQLILESYLRGLE